MEIGETTTTTATKPQARTGLSGDFDSFLKLLTTQLQNQDPTSPMDSDQFTRQLVQFSSVEQQIRSNETLTELTNLIRGNQLTQSVSYIGAEVEADSDIVSLGDDGVAKIYYELGAQASEVTITISDELGRPVASLAGQGAEGRHSLTWDGLGDNGTRYDEGSFKVEVLAKTSSGSPVSASTTISGVVDGVELIDGRTLLSVDGVLMSLDRITAVRTATEAA